MLPGLNGTAPGITDLARLPIPDRMRAVRAMLGMSQSQLAAALEVSPRTVKGWEHPDLPRGAPHYPHARRLAELLGGGYPPELFAGEISVEAALAIVIDEKLDRLMAHLGLEDR